MVANVCAWGWGYFSSLISCCCCESFSLFCHMLWVYHSFAIYSLVFSLFMCSVVISSWILVAAIILRLAVHTTCIHNMQLRWACILVIHRAAWALHLQRMYEDRQKFCMLHTRVGFDPIKFLNLGCTSFSMPLHLRKLDAEWDHVHPNP